jgi:hypothetical protein
LRATLLQEYISRGDAEGSKRIASTQRSPSEESPPGRAFQCVVATRERSAGRHTFTTNKPPPAGARPRTDVSEGSLGHGASLPAFGPAADAPAVLWLWLAG